MQVRFSPKTGYQRARSCSAAAVVNVNRKTPFETQNFIDH